MRSREPYPLRADIVHVSEYRRDGAALAGRLGPPSGGVKIFNQHLIHAFIGGKDPDCRFAELSLNIGLSRGHGSHSSAYLTSRQARDAKESAVHIWSRNGRTRGM